MSLKILELGSSKGSSFWHPRRWCAYEVDENGVAVDGKWADCNDACPTDGEDAPVSCDESALFNLDGSCVEQTIEAKLAEDKPPYAFRIESGATEVEVAPVCKSEGIN